MHTDVFFSLSFVYKIVEILVAFVPSIALMAIAFSFDLELYYFVTALSILILLLQLVSTKEFVSIMRRPNSIHQRCHSVLLCAFQ